MIDQTEPNSCTVHFLPSGRQIKIVAGSILLEAARQAGVHINASCGGSGVCGKCLVKLESGRVEGGTGAPLTAEQEAGGLLQACSARIRSDLQVRLLTESHFKTDTLSAAIPEKHRARLHLFNIEELRQEGIFLPPVEKLFIELPRPSGQDRMADAGRLLLGLSNQYDERGLVISLPVLRKLRRTMREEDFRVTVTLARPVRTKAKAYILNIQPGNWTRRNFGLAVDIGTTTIHGQLVDLQSGSILAAGADYNRQMSYGEDVISRAIHAEKPEGLATMERLASETINTIIEQLLQEAGIDRDEITSATFAGNTVMTHLFLGLEPHNLRRAPYVPVSTYFPPIRATNLDLDLPQHVVSMIYPSISSYVGGDIVAGVMGSGMYRTRALTLYVDIGTNAEIVIGNRDWLVCAACSAGPAFEGGGITHGMRAAPGAIEDFSLDPVTLEPMNITIGRKRPLGICGSGLLAMVSALFENGVIDQRGKFNRNLSGPRIRTGRSGHEFLLVGAAESGTGEDLVLNEVDIENFIRAKAAIYAGIKTLVEEVGLQLTDLEQVILAGAFGSYLDLDYAMTVGLLPELDPTRVLYVGNGSLMGARMSELSNHIRRDVMAVVERMTSFELSETHSFKDQYMASLFLPHTDGSLFPEVSKRLAARPQAGAGEGNGPLITPEP